MSKPKAASADIFGKRMGLLRDRGGIDNISSCRLYGLVSRIYEIAICFARDAEYNLKVISGYFKNIYNRYKNLPVVHLII